MSHPLLSYAPLLVLLAWAAIGDVRYRRVPNWLTMLIMVGGVVQSLLPTRTVSISTSLLGILAAAAVPLAGGAAWAETGRLWPRREGFTAPDQGQQRSAGAGPDRDVLSALLDREALRRQPRRLSATTRVRASVRAAFSALRCASCADAATSRPVHSSGSMSERSPRYVGWRSVPSRVSSA